MSPPADIEHLLRELAPQVLGSLVRRGGDFDTSEDAVQEALLAAATQWPIEGVPTNPRGWLTTVASRVPIQSLAVHFHDTYGQALANILACLELGVSAIDSAASGLGGCPYAAGASGNVATEDVVYMLDGMGVKTGIDLEKLVAAGQQISRELGREPASRVGRLERRWPSRAA